MMIKSVVPCPFVVMLLACGALTLSGCAGKKKAFPLKPSKQTASMKIDNTPAQREAEHLEPCQKELLALKDIKPGQYKTFSHAFERLMSSAAQYANLRRHVSDDTQQTVDTLYRYKASRLCAYISQATLNGLTDRGEQLQ